VIPNRVLDTEEKGQFRSGILHPGEDTGIDGLTDDQERAQYSAFIEANKADFPSIVEDPAGDDWSYRPTAEIRSENYRNINGTENNQTSENGHFPDTEDLNRNNVLDRTNSYFEYTLDLNDPALRVGGGTNGWYQYRIPIQNFSSKVGTPDFSLIEDVRFWFTGFDSSAEFQMTEFNLVGNQWEEMTKNDSTFKVSTVSFEDNPDYSKPPGVVQEQDRTQNPPIAQNEQSLSLVLNQMKSGVSRQAIKRFTYRPLDVFSYREMKLFVNCDPLIERGDAEVFIRFGSDTLNYYEYRAPLIPGATRADYTWQDLKIVFADITSIKQGRKDPNQRDSIAVKDQPGARYYVLGNPTLTRVTYISVGIQNISTIANRTLTGAVWINELRLLGADDTPGWAYSVSASMKLADLGSVAFSYSNVDPNFHSLENRVGSRTTNRNWNLSANVSMEKFLPMEWAGTSIPFSYSHSEGLVTPKYLPGSDVVVGKAAEVVQLRASNPAEGQRLADSINTTSQSMSITDTYAVPSFKINVPSERWYFKELFNKFGYGFSYTSSTLRNPSITFQNSWSWNSRLSYANTLPQDLFITPFFFVDALKDWRLYYVPITNFSLSASANRSRTTSNTRGQIDTSITRSFTGARQFGFGWKGPENGLLNLTGDYSVDVSSTLVDFETVKDSSSGKVLLRQRPFANIISSLWQSGKLFTLGEQNAYNQTISVNTKPRFAEIFDAASYLSFTFRYNVSYRWQNNLQQGDLGKGTGWGNSISFGIDFTSLALVDKWFPTVATDARPGEPESPATPRGRGRRDDEVTPVNPPQPGMQLKDTTSRKPDSLSTSPLDVKKSSAVQEFLKNAISRKGIRWALMFDKFSFSFAQSNSAQNSGVPGSHGFMNLFGKLPFQPQQPSDGATRAYQLGLVSDPTLDLGVAASASFPFFHFFTDTIGVRAPNANVSNGFTQNNKVTFRTGHELWSGARVELNWSVNVDYSENMTLTTDSRGVPSIVSRATGGAVERSFFTLFKNDATWLASLADKSDADLPAAFRNLESVSLFGRFFPRVNYTFHWEGLEKLPLLDKIATRVSLEHAYASSYRETFKGNPSGDQSTESQRISEGFSPLAGVSMTLKGNITANIRYGMNNSFDLVPSSKNVVQNSTNDISFTGNYSISGFEIPLFGLALTNDLDFSFSYTYSNTVRKTFPVGIQIVQQQAAQGEGSSRTVLEPRVRYVLSSRVTASLFYRYTKIAPDDLGSRIPGSTTNEGGADIHIAIQ
jgi:hypothetical protein